MKPTDPRGLATVALLKTRFDQGKDHLGLFEPFVEDALRNISANNFIASDICSVVHSRSGLVIPTNTMQALLGRFAKSGYISRQGGRFLRTSKSFKGPGMDDSAFLWFDRVEGWPIPVMISLRNMGSPETRKDSRYVALLRKLGMPVLEESSRP